MMMMMMTMMVVVVVVVVEGERDIHITDSTVAVAAGRLWNNEYQ